MEMGSLRVTNTSFKWSKWLKRKKNPPEKGTVAMVRIFLIQIITDDAAVGRTFKCGH